MASAGQIFPDKSFYECKQLCTDRAGWVGSEACKAFAYKSDDMFEIECQLKLRSPWDLPDPDNQLVESDGYDLHFYCVKDISEGFKFYNRLNNILLLR